jgi:hypothetical protein
MVPSDVDAFHVCVCVCVCVGGWVRMCVSVYDRNRGVDPASHGVGGRTG